MRIRLLVLLIFLSSISFAQQQDQNRDERRDERRDQRRDQRSDQRKEERQERQDERDRLERLRRASRTGQLVYTRVVSGTLFIPPGTPAGNSKMRFSLKYCGGQNGRVPVNPGVPPGPTGIIVSEPFDVYVQSDGSWQTQVYGNDQIICGTDMSGPSRWLIQPIFNGEAGAGVEYQINSCGAANPCQPFSPDTALACGSPNPNPPPPTVTTDCALGNANPDQPDTTVTVNATMAVPNAINFSNILLPPANGTVINFLLNGNQAGAYLPGNGNSSSCLSGTGTWVTCGGGGGAGGVTGATPGGGLVLSGSSLGLMRTCTVNQYLVWNASAWVCATPGGGGGGLVTIPQYNLYASDGAGGTQDSTIKAGPPGFLMTEVTLATGDISSAPPPFQVFPNASVEYFPSGYTWSGGTAGAAHGFAGYFSHSSGTGATANGGIGLGGGNSSGGANQIYLDCETTGCDFKVPVTLNGSGLGGGGGSLPTIPQWNLFASTGAGSAVDSGVGAESGYLRAQVLEASGSTGAAPGGFAPPNGSIEYFPSGATYGGLNIGATNGVAIHFSHSANANTVGNGGIALAGGNSSGTGSTYQIYLDCEQATGCDFKVPVTHNGGTIGTITGVTTGGGLMVSGTTLGMLNTCSPNQILQWNGTVWACASNIAGTTVQVGGVGMGALANFITGTPPTNGRSISFASSGTSVTAALVGDGTTNCLSGTGAYVVCGSPTPVPNQSTGVFTNQLSATLTSTAATTNLVWACWDNSTPANAIYPSNVSVNPSTYLVTFNFSVPQSGQCIVNSSGGGGGGAGTITGATPSGGLAVSGTTLGLMNCLGNQILQYSGTAWACINTPTGGGGGSGTVNSGTGGRFTWYAAAGTTVSSNANLDDSITTPATITSQETIAAPGIKVTGTGGISLTGAGGTLPTPASGQGGIGIGPGNVPSYYSNGGTWTAIGSGGGPTIYTCTIPADTSFGTNICSQALGATARQWRVHCSIPWNFTGGSGTSNVVIGINLSATPSYQTYLTPVMWATTGATNMGAIAVSASGNTAIITANGLTAGTGGTIFTVNLDGTVAAAANTTIYIYGTATVGTAAFRPGVTCELI